MSVCVFVFVCWYIYFSFWRRILFVCQAWREVMRGCEGPSGTVSIWSWSPLFFGCPLNLVLYMPFRIFAYSSNILKTNFDLMESMPALWPRFPGVSLNNYWRLLGIRPPVHSIWFWGFFPRQCRWIAIWWMWGGPIPREWYANTDGVWDCECVYFREGFALVLYVT